MIGLEEREPKGALPERREPQLPAEDGARTPRYLQSLLLLFVLPVLFLWPSIWSTVEHKPFLASIAVISAIGWCWSIVVTSRRWWKFPERFLAGPRVIRHLPIEEFLFYPFGGILSIYAYVSAARRFKPLRSVSVYWACLVVGSVAFVAFALAAGERYKKARWFPAWPTLLLPFLVAFWFLYRAARHKVNWRAAFATVAVFELVCFPAEIFSVSRGHWIYNDARIWGPRWFHVPVEEMLLYYLFSPLIIITIMQAVRVALERDPK